MWSRDQEGLGRLSAEPRETSCAVMCICGARVSIGIPDNCAVLPSFACQRCGAAIDERAVYLGNLQALRAEVTQLGDAVGVVLAALAHAYRFNPAGVRGDPVGALERVVDSVSLYGNAQAVGALRDAVFGRK